jgi:hypothetical protein
MAEQTYMYEIEVRTVEGRSHIYEIRATHSAEAIIASVVRHTYNDRGSIDYVQVNAHG